MLPEAVRSACCDRRSRQLGAFIAGVVDTTLAHVELTAAGLGVGFQTCYSADMDPRLQRVGPLFDFGLSLWLLTHPDVRRTARIATFMKFVGDALQRHRPRLEGTHCEHND